MTSWRVARTNATGCSVNSMASSAATTGRPTALIVGAGIGGLAAGVALRRAGWNVRVYERAAQPRELGFGLLLAPNALAALEELGVGDEVKRAGAVNGWMEIRRMNGDLIRRLNAPLGGPSIVALRSTLHGALLASVGADALRLGREVVAFSASGEGVTIRCSDATEDTGALLVGADGVVSVVRRLLHPDESPPRRSAAFQASCTSTTGLKRPRSGRQPMRSTGICHCSRTQ